MYDGEGRVIICNQRYRQIYALSEQDVRPGRTLWELLQTRKDRGLLKEPPERYSVPLKAALAERKSIDFVTELTDGRVIAIANRPMPDGRWVSTHDDITVQQNSEKALRDQKMQLDAALNNMSQGLCMFDGDARLILCNHRYLQMSGLSVSDLQPDITLVELLEKRRAKGTWSSDPKKYTEELRATLAKGESRSRWKAPAAAPSRSTTARCPTGNGCPATRTSPSGARRSSRPTNKSAGSTRRFRTCRKSFACSIRTAGSSCPIRATPR